jgi:large subunit ribosomal protein L13
MIVIDASDLLLGRLASYAAKQALLGKTVRIINSENACISGKKNQILKNYNQKRQRGTHSTGPFFPRYPDQIIKRTIRGMIPFKKPRGRKAYKRIRCYIGIPDEFKDKKSITIENAKISKLSKLKYIKIKTLSKSLGAKID